MPTPKARSVQKRSRSEREDWGGEESATGEEWGDLTLSNELFFSRDLPASQVLVQINSHILRVFDQLQEKKWDLENKLKYQTLKANVYRAKLQVK